MKLFPATFCTFTFFLASCLCLSFSSSQAADSAKKIETVVLGAGCFWCVESIFQTIPGVISVTSGFAGGLEKDPTYEAVSSGQTGHAEVVQIEFDSAVVTYEKLLESFWNSHDASVKNGVAPDFGTQYRSIILYQNDREKGKAETSKAAWQKKLGKPVQTEISRLETFYPAEAYHQDFVKLHPLHPYVLGVSLPRLKETQAKLKLLQLQDVNKKIGLLALFLFISSIK